MFTNIKIAVAMLIIAVVSFGCSNRMVDFTIISSKSLSLHCQDNAKGQRVKGSSMGFLGLGANVKSAVDDAIEKAGNGYDALIDGVLYEKDNIIVTGYEIEGTPVNTSKLIAELGDEGFKKFCMEHKVEFRSDKD
jgi:hypothetical protein